MSKYHARKVVADGLTFASQAEYYDYLKLRDREEHGEISGLRLQPRYLLQAAFVYRGQKVAKIEYVADFEFLEDGVTVAWDTKGGTATMTPVFRLKLKLAQARYPQIEFRVVSS